MTHSKRNTAPEFRVTTRTLWLAAAAVVACAGLIATPSAATSAKICSKTTKLQFRACYAEVRDDTYTAQAKCSNVIDKDARDECFSDAREERSESYALCRDQREARKGMCDDIGEDAYEPDMNPALFQDPRNPTTTNPYFPLAIGNRWVFQDQEERVEINVLDETKRVEGAIDCLVVNDVVHKNGLLVEDTADWFALRTDGTVVYCGELSLDFEFFEGDDPEEVQLSSIEGSFKTGVEGAKSGTAFLATPTEGTAYRQEWDAGNAEDNGKVLATDYAHGKNAELDQFVPKALADLMCAHSDCVVIRDTSSLDPEAFERKYYAKGLGKFLEVKPNEGLAVPLIECNVDSRCASLPVN